MLDTVLLGCSALSAVYLASRNLLHIRVSLCFHLTYTGTLGGISFSISLVYIHNVEVQSLWGEGTERIGGSHN